MPSSPTRSPSAKRFRFSSIDRLLNSPERPSSAESANSERPSPPPTPGHYVRKINCGTVLSDRFKMAKFCNQFIIENVPENPESLLRGIFTKCINDAVETAAAHQGSKPDRVGVMIGSQLLHDDIWVPIRPIQEDTVENVLNRFLQIVQSPSVMDEKGNVLGEPFTVSVTTLNAAALPRQPQIRGRGNFRRKQVQVQHQVSQASLIDVNNPEGRYCLFYALELTRKHKLMEPQAFRNYHHTQQQQQYRDVQMLMDGAGIPMDLPDYDAITYVPMVVDRWNQLYADEGLVFKVFVFGEFGDYRPRFMYGPDNFNMPIAIFHQQEHFYGVRNAGSLHRKDNKYCFTCLVPYRHAKDHNKGCKARCTNCGRVGTGRPCPAEAGFADLKCADCNRVFRNADCHDHHKRSNECQRTKRCGDCGKLWCVKDNTRDGRPGHVCGERYCLTCEKFHDPDRGCYIQPLEPRDEEKQTPYRVVCFDFESTQHEELSEQHPEKKAAQRQLCVSGRHVQSVH